MNKEQIIKMKKECLFPDSCENSAISETHISWVVLTDNYAFKVKKPVKYSFLDFSTLEKREFYCHQEVKLNKRLEPDMYLGVIPISKSLIGGESNKKDAIIDYAVKMKRMDNDKEMHKLLEKNKVTKEQLEKLAQKIAKFHKNTQIVKNTFNTSKMIDDYSDIINVINNDSRNQILSQEYKDIIVKCIEKSKNYLNDNRSFFNERIISGFQRDCHGDLKATNIFLYDNPVIFDCIEFNEELRYIDILNDIAFLCVDLDFYESKDMSSYFVNKYIKAFGMKEQEMPQSLFNYYKSYRANIRAKVILISLKQHPDDEQIIEDAKRYIKLMNKYVEQF